MTMHQPGQPSSGGNVVPMLVLTVLGLIGITVGIIVLLFMLQGPGGRAAAPSAPRQASLAQASLPAPAPSLPTVITSSVGVGRPLPMPPQGHQALSRREPNGYFLFNTMVNGMTVRMVFDTGATTVALRAEDAARAGIAVNGLNYNGSTKTANGTAEVAYIMLDSLKVGDITRYNVPAIVSRPGMLFVSLLGQSFMSKLSGYRFEGSELILQGD
jgi:clan AA aspartic protease (TIGR02281 family)